MSTIISLAVMILMMAAMWKVFVKLGEQPWKSLIPLLNSYVLFRRLWAPFPWFLAMLVFSFTGGTLISFSMASIASLTPNESLACGIGLLGCGLLIAALVIQCILYWKLVKKFGKDTLFFIGILVFPVVFFPILAFGDAKPIE